MTDIRCKNCGFALSKWQNGKLRIHVQSRVLGITRSGDVEIICPSCKQMTRLPLRINKAESRGTGSLTPDSDEK